ncbi:MAG TPA: hypothetical protein PLN24_04710, partial [Victivallales bacterium]|nr:hypothetical protein [Victivallales bacterium]
MKTFYREPMIEEGIHNIILQNRCGNRLTLLCLTDRCEMEFVYKPNAFRRKDFRSRNFSNRDNQTTLFDSFYLPDITSSMIKNVYYDPFYTKLEVKSESGAINIISVVNLADENCFVISARQPLLLAIKPHFEFNVSDGILYELFSERGEDIVAFISFPGFELNRYRMLDDGTHVLQILENDILLIGGEENKMQMTRILRRFEGMPLDELILQNEKTIKTTLYKSLVYVNEDDFQDVIDLNRRIIFSGMDEGGACFGALNRIYYLIWVRDGSMTSCHMALAGNPIFIQRWAPFLLFNPSQTMVNEKKVVRDFSQLVGTRWSKSEDDGLFYAVWTAFTYFRTIGDISLFSDELINLLIECIENHLERCWDKRICLLSSDTLGEDPLTASPYFGYDIVNGSMLKTRYQDYKHNDIVRCSSLYHQVNMYNVLLMTVCLLNECDRTDLLEYQKRYLKIANELRNSLRKNFISEDGKLYSLRFDMVDGTEKFLGIVKGIDYWEHGWAVSQGPFFPLPYHQIESCRELYKSWESIAGTYGFCPWNVMARQLFNY